MVKAVVLVGEDELAEQLLSGLFVVCSPMAEEAVGEVLIIDPTLDASSRS